MHHTWHSPKAIPSLTSLFLTASRTCSEGAKHLAKVLKATSSLSVLRLDSNLICNRGATDALKTNSALKDLNAVTCSKKPRTS